MEIQWHGGACFSFKGEKATVLINPDQEEQIKQADLVFASFENRGKSAQNSAQEFKILDWPGEYEIKGVSVTALAVKTSDDESAGHTLIFHFQLDGFRVCYLGYLGHALSNDQVKEIGDVDILLAPLGGMTKLKKNDLVEILENIDPRLLIPMGEGDLQPLFKEIGAEEMQIFDKFNIKNRSQLPEDKRGHILLSS